LSLRLGLIVAAALALVFSATMLTFIMLQRPGRVYGVVLPLPRQAAAMADLIENLPSSQWPTATAAISTPATKVSVLGAPPATRGGMAMPGVTVALRAYLAAMDGRPVSIMAGLRRLDQSPDVRLGNEMVRATSPVRIVIGLHNGKLLVIEAMGPASQRFTGVRLGVLALSVTLLIGFGALWFMNRQMRPLEQLAKAVEQFGTRLEASTLKEEGTIELRQLIAAFNRLQANIGDLVRGRTRIISAVGHDLGTYLTRLRLRAEYIADTDQRARAIRDIDDMHGLMQETLALAKLQHDGDGDTPVDIAPLLKKTIAGFAEAGGPVREFLPGTPVMVRIGPAAFARAAGNLISNALKYGGEADVRLSSSGATAELVVEDRGPGIPPEERAAVLEPFYRRDSARNLNERGFGLGLAIVSEVVKGAGGTLTFEDRDGGGLRVKIALPLA
jgi:signal transduction histidine kinase